MNTSNIISAGKMLAIALMLIGIIICVATFLYFGEKLTALDSETIREALFSNIMSGLAILFSSIALVVMFPRAERHPVLADPILIMGIFILIVGVSAFCIMPTNPFTWIMAVVCIPMFITALCLKINLAKK
jgi:uncharacterized membrane protein